MKKEEFSCTCVANALVFSFYKFFLTRRRTTLLLHNNLLASGGGTTNVTSRLVKFNKTVPSRFKRDLSLIKKKSPIKTADFQQQLRFNYLYFQDRIVWILFLCF